MPDDAVIQALMAAAAQQGGGGGGAPGAMPPGGPPPGAPVRPGGAPPGAPPPGGMGGPPGAAGPPGMGRPPGMAGPQAQGPAPQEAIQVGLLALMDGMTKLGLQETFNNKVLPAIQQAVQKLMKNTPTGRQQAGVGASVPPKPVPGTGPMPGQPVT